MLVYGKCCQFVVGCVSFFLSSLLSVVLQFVMLSLKLHLLLVWAERALNFCAFVTSENILWKNPDVKPKTEQHKNLLVSSAVATFYVNSSDYTIYFLPFTEPRHFWWNHPERDFHIFYGSLTAGTRTKNTFFLTIFFSSLFHCLSTKVKLSKWYLS